LRRPRKTDIEGVDVTCWDRLYQVRTAVTGKARSPYSVHVIGLPVIIYNHAMFTISVFVVCGIGIAVEKQHLIWKSVEMEDKIKIADYKLTTGATIQLVTAMRGGPLNIRRGN